MIMFTVFKVRVAAPSGTLKKLEGRKQKRLLFILFYIIICLKFPMVPECSSKNIFCSTSHRFAKGV